MKAVLTGLLFVFALCFIYAAIGVWLWGLIMVPIFGLPALGYWQMFGLMVLLRMLFGGDGSNSN